MISATELALQRALTAYFIAADSLSVALTRNTKVPTAAGGYKAVSTVLPVQTVRMIPLGDGAAERLTADGKQVSPQYMLQGQWDADFARGDTFTLDGRRYELVFINQNVQYQVKAEVYYLGD
jgi:hypothetical protein